MPNRMMLLTPSARAALVSFTASSTERLQTPGIDGTSRRTPSPSQTNSGSTNMSGERRVSRTSARIGAERRSLRNRRVSFSDVWVWVWGMGGARGSGFGGRDSLLRNGDRLFEMFHDGVDQCRDGVARRYDRRRDVALRGRLRGDRADGGDDGRAQEIGGRFGAEHAHEIAHRRRARERDDID